MTDLVYSITMRKAVYLIILPLIIIACGTLWQGTHYLVESIVDEGGTKDLRDGSVENTAIDLFGSVDFIPNALLTPEEFEARGQDIMVGFPEREAKYSTSRMRILLPDGVYGIMLWNADQASRIYINGRFMESVGNPASDPNQAVGAFRLLLYTVETEDGAIEILQQASRAIDASGGGYADVIIGKPDVIRGIYEKQYINAAILLGCFLVLALAHFSLFVFRREYKANLWATIFCLVWFFRTGLMPNTWLITSYLPLHILTILRVLELTIPASALLLFLTLEAVFPGVLKKWFLILMIPICLMFVGFFLVGEAGFISVALPVFYGIIVTSAAFISIQLFTRRKKPQTEEVVILVGIAIFIFGVMRDILVYSTPVLVSGKQITASMTPDLISNYTLLLFLLFQMTAMFLSTVSEAQAAREAEERLSLENAALDRISNLKNEMMQNLTHELRTPLAVMSTYAQLAIKDLQQEEQSDQTSEDLKTIREEAERLADMVSDYLDVFREQEAERGRKAVDIGALLRQTGTLCRPMLMKKGNKLRLRLPEQLPKVVGNNDELTQVMLNLVTNSNKHTKNGRITINVAVAEKNFIEVLVSDTGEGISPEFLPRVFDRFFTDGGGAGIGLSISKEIIESHGGEIMVDSQKGQGTVVRFTVPILVEGVEDDREGKSVNTGN